MSAEMPTTPDGISSEDWDRVHELAIDVVNAEEGEEEDLCRSRLLEYLDELEAQYGARPSILATRADYLVNDVPGRLALFNRAYALAAEVDDVRNQLSTGENASASEQACSGFSPARSGRHFWCCARQLMIR